MLKFYVSSMNENGAAKATVYNFAVNYLASVTILFNIKSYFSEPCSSMKLSIIDSF